MSNTKNACGEIEALERRVLLNGAVTATFRSGDLALSGDASHNQVRIVRRSATTTRVEGLEGTRVNGRAFADFNGAIDDVTVSMRQGGEDEVQVQGPLTIGGDVEGHIGDGRFVVEGSAGRVQINGGLEVDAGDEGEINVRNDVVVNGEAELNAGGETSAASSLAFVPDFAAARFGDPLDIDNPYFPLVVGTKYTYEERSVDDETGEAVLETVVVEVTNRTKTILGVRNRVLRDRVYVDGLLVEDTFDWHAQDDAGNVWYFGEESTDFEYDDEGNLIGTSTATSWQAGVDGARPGVIMLARPRPGPSYYQEFYPGVALDQGQVLSTGERATVPAGRFTGVVRTKDTSVLSPGGLEHKFYAPGLGLIREHAIDVQSGEVEGVLRLLSAERNGKRISSVVPAGGFEGANVTGRTTGAVRFRGESSFRAGGDVVLSQVRFGDEVEVVGESDVTVLDTTLEDLTLRAAGSVALRKVTATEEVLLSAGGDVFIFDSRFNEDVEILLGAGDNELVVGRSRFDELEADGGRGHDTFDDRGGNVVEELDLRRFEED